MVWENLAPRKPEQFYQRLKGVAAGISFVFFLLLARLVWMQVVEGERYHALAYFNSVSSVPLRAPRGLMLDRNLEVMVGNSPSLTVGLTPAPLLGRPELAESVFALLASLLELDAQAIREKFERQKTRPFAPVRLATNVDRALVTRLEELRDKLPGVVVLTDSKRNYPSPAAAHALGYVSEITDAQLNSLTAKGYRLGDLVGQTGLERVYDEILKGEDGGFFIQVNSLGRQLKELNQVAPLPGNNLVLTLSLKLQQVAEEALRGQSGAVVALDPRNGEVLALCSAPDYDLSQFSGRIKPADWQALMEDEQHPFTNRAIQGLYPPGSVFKIVTTSAGLESGAIVPETAFTCLGIYWISTWPYRCWKEVGHGTLTLHRAIVESCDIYFYHVGLKTKVDALSQYAREYGFGAATGIDLPGEASGLVPSAAWKERTQHMPWFPGNTVMMSIGQGYLLATPLQLAMMTALVANGGVCYAPHLLKRITDQAGRTLKEIEPQPVRQAKVSAETIRIIQRAMTDAVNVPGGTAWRARVAGLVVAGKTGTAQNPHGEDHADFVSFAPAENPQLVVAVVVENGGEGGLTAAPIAKKIYEAYFAK